jgi:hypothetical protein
MASFAPDLLPAASAQTVASPRGTVRIWHPAPTVFVSQVEGSLTEQGARALCVAGRRIIASDERLVVFQDWEAATDYERGARLELTRMALDLRKSVDASYFLLRARILALGVQLANVVLGNLKVLPNRAAMEELLRATLQTRPPGRPRA